MRPMVLVGMAHFAMVHFAIFWGTIYAVAAVGAEPTDQAQHVSVERLRGTDVDGRLHEFSKMRGGRAVVVVFLATDCPISNAFLPELNRLSSAFRDRDVHFYGVVSAPYVTRAAVLKHRDEYGIEFPVLFDGGRSLQRLLAPTHTPEAVVVSMRGIVSYRGRINNLFSRIGRRRETASVHDLRNALDAIVAGNTVAHRVTVPVGCPLEELPAPSAESHFTYNRDIAPVLTENCSECHRPAQSAPFSLLSYRDAVRHARQIVRVTEDGIMPPWHPQGGYGTFRNARGLSQGEKRRIRRWFEEGMAEGAAADRPPRPIFNSGWRLGPPDLILSMDGEFVLPADGGDVHQHFVLPTGLSTERMVTAIEFRPGNPRIVHHASFYIDTSGVAQQLAARHADQGYAGGPGPGFRNVGVLRSWLPGMSPQKLPLGFGRPLPANSDLVVEIHYRPSGRKETDQSTLGIYFAEGLVPFPVAELQIMNSALNIPAGASRHLHYASYTLPADTLLLDVAPHMHYLGREMKAIATRPDGTIEKLIWIKDWDFHWQGQYLYEKPLSLPRGTRIDVEAIYDNSVKNPLNPNSPPIRVYWGDASSDEMGICHFRFTCETPEGFQRMTTDSLRYADRQLMKRRRLESLRKSP